MKFEYSRHDSNHKKTPKFLVLLLLLNSSLTFAQIKVENFKEREQLLKFKPQYQHLAPEAAHFLLRHGELNARAKYHNPKNPVEKFIPVLVNSTSDIPESLQVSPLTKNIAPLLGPTTVGKILKELTLNTTNNLQKVIESDAEFIERVAKLQEKALPIQQQIEAYEKKMGLLQAQEDFKSKNQEFGQLKSKRNLLRKQITDCQQDQQGPQKQLKVLTDLFKEIDTNYLLIEQAKTAAEKEKEIIHQQLIKDKTYIELKNKLAQFTYKTEHLKDFIKLLLAAWNNSKAPAGDSQEFIEKALVSVALLNSKNEKNELLKLYSQIPHVLTEESTLKLNELLGVSLWKRLKFGPKDYLELNEKLKLMDHDEKAAYLIAHSSDLALLLEGENIYEERGLPPMSYSRVTYHHPQYGNVNYADCMDSS